MTSFLPWTCSPVHSSMPQISQRLLFFYNGVLSTLWQSIEIPNGQERLIPTTTFGPEPEFLLWKGFPKKSSEEILSQNNSSPNNPPLIHDRQNILQVQDSRMYWTLISKRLTNPLARKFLHCMFMLGFYVHAVWPFNVNFLFLVGVFIMKFNLHKFPLFSINVSTYWRVRWHLRFQSGPQHI